MTESVQALRDRLSSREAALTSLRSRIKSAKVLPSAPHTISDIQKRYLSAVTQLEDKEKQASKPVSRSSTDAVSSLTSKWNKGIQGKKIERATIDVRGDVDATKKTFSAKDTPKFSITNLSEPRKEVVNHGPAQFIVEDDSEVPSWAKNQQKLIIRKENARNSVRDVDVRNLQGSVLDSATRDHPEPDRTKVAVGGNVKAALAMWGKTAEEDAKVLAHKKEEDRKRALAAEKERQAKEVEQRAAAIQAATAKFSEMNLSELKSEPEDEAELIAFFERKIALIDKEIKAAEDELDKLEDSQ